MHTDASGHAMRLAGLQHAIGAGGAAGRGPIGLDKRSSNLFRDRRAVAKQRLDFSALCHVLEVDAGAGWVDVEGMATYEDLVAQTLPLGVMPAVVPQLKTITVGGAAAGVGIEATSFRHGLVHDTVLELDVLLPDGTVVHCTPTNAHRDLFFGFPNSYGTLGYAVRLRLRTIPVKPFVRVEHVPAQAAQAFFDSLGRHCAGPCDFIDAVVFGPRQQVINLASFVDTAPWCSDYGFEQIYYRSLNAKPLDFLRVQDYIWRWDTDWFWCSKNLFAQHPLVRRLLGRSRLNSRTYTRVMRWNTRWGLTRRLARLRGRHPESVIQDVDIPLAAAPAFLEFLLCEIGILPIWICPLRCPDPAAPWLLYPLAGDGLYVNFGFWDVVESPVAHEPGHFNRLVEREAMRLGGIKSLYSDSFFTRDEFDRAYGMAQYRALKARYDPNGRLLDLYDKCVLRA